uniref:Glycosyltransferase n=1 Tax=Triticum aestivum TaxID=4565 RepID=A0A3B6NTC0_WHEAT
MWFPLSRFVYGHSFFPPSRAVALHWNTFTLGDRTQQSAHSAADAPSALVRNPQWRGPHAKPWPRRPRPPAAACTDTRSRLLPRPRRSGEPRRRSSSPRPWRCPAPCCTEPSCRMRLRWCRSCGIAGPRGSGARHELRLWSPSPRRTATSTPFPPTICEYLKLEQVLQAASMDNKTIILTTLNAAWSSPGSVIDLYIDSFRHGVRTSSLLKHLVIIAFDRKAYRRCTEIHTYCYALVTGNVDFSQEKRFLTAGYLEMMWTRLDFLRLVLEKGYSFIFSDADIMWFRNPFPYFYPDGDLQVACDHYVGNATDLRNIANGGFNYVKSNNQSIEFYKFWYSSRLRYPGYHDQDVLNFIKHDPYIMDIGLTIKFLSTTYFGGICEPSKDLNEVCTMHANCCIGLQSKLHDLRIIMEDWRDYMSMPPSLKTPGAFSWRVPQNCSLSLLNQ